MSKGEDLGIVLRELVQGIGMLALVEGESGPACHELGRGDDGIATEEDARAGQPKGEMAWCVARRVDHGQRANRVTLADERIYGTGWVLGDVDVVANLKVIGDERVLWSPRDLLCHAFTGNDVGFPGVSIDRCAAHAFKRGQSPQMRTVRMGQNNMFEIGRGSIDGADLVGDDTGIGIEEGINERQAAAVVNQKCV